MSLDYWLILACTPAAWATSLFVRDAFRQHRINKAQRRLAAACLDHATTVKRLDAAKARGRDVIDQHLAETPIYAETCEAEARRIAAAELDADLRRLFDGSAS